MEDTRRDLFDANNWNDVYYTNFQNQIYHLQNDISALKQKNYTVNMNNKKLKKKIIDLYKVIDNLKAFIISRMPEFMSSIIEYL